jgi:hypothetical protein
LPLTSIGAPTAGADISSSILCTLIPSTV